MSQYASITDLYAYGFPLTAQGNLKSDQLDDALVAASAMADSFLVARYALPLVNPQTEIALVEAVAKIAAYQLLSIRGYNPASGADVNIRNRYEDAIRWLNLVQRQQANLLNQPLPVTGTQYNQPTLISNTLINLDTGFSGGTGNIRGW